MAVPRMPWTKCVEGILGVQQIQQISRIILNFHLGVHHSGRSPCKKCKPREFNYRVHFIHWRKILYKTWIYHRLQLMLETSLYAK